MLEKVHIFFKMLKVWVGLSLISLNAFFAGMMSVVPGNSAIDFSYCCESEFFSKLLSIPAEPWLVKISKDKARGPINYESSIINKDPIIISDDRGKLEDETTTTLEDPQHHSIYIFNSHIPRLQMCNKEVSEIQDPIKKLRIMLSRDSTKFCCLKKLKATDTTGKVTVSGNKTNITDKSTKQPVDTTLNKTQSESPSQQKTQPIPLAENQAIPESDANPSQNNKVLGQLATEVNDSTLIDSENSIKNSEEPLDVDIKVEEIPRGFDTTNLSEEDKFSFFFLINQKNNTMYFISLNGWLFPLISFPKSFNALPDPKSVYLWNFHYCFCVVEEGKYLFDPYKILDLRLNDFKGINFDIAEIDIDNVLFCNYRSNDVNMDRADSHPTNQIEIKYLDNRYFKDCYYQPDQSKYYSIPLNFGTKAIFIVIMTLTAAIPLLFIQSLSQLTNFNLLNLKLALSASVILLYFISLGFYIKSNFFN